MESLRTGLSALSVGAERRNYQVSPSIGGGGDRRVYAVSSPATVAERRAYATASPKFDVVTGGGVQQKSYSPSQQLMGEQRSYQVSPNLVDLMADYSGRFVSQQMSRDFEITVDMHHQPTTAAVATPKFKSAGAAAVSPAAHIRSYRDSPCSLDAPRSYTTSPASCLAGQRSFRESPQLVTAAPPGRPQEWRITPEIEIMDGDSSRANYSQHHLYHHQHSHQDSLDVGVDCRQELEQPVDGFTSTELRRFGQARPRSPGIITSHKQHKNRNASINRLGGGNRMPKKVEDRHPGSDSCYSRSDNSSTHSDPPPRVPAVHPASSTRSYDTTSMSSMDTSSSVDLWNVRAMPNVRITRLDKPVYLRPNPGARNRRPNVFDSLTDELIVKILGFLTTKELMKTARVSRKFYFLSWEPQLWRSINLTGEERDVDRTLSSIFQIIAKVKSDGNR